MLLCHPFAVQSSDALSRDTALTFQHRMYPLSESLFGVLRAISQYTNIQVQKSIFFIDVKFH